MTHPAQDPPKVSVCVITYNHARYLATCLQSILDQQTDFTFEVIVGDDCSSDGTQEILRNFAARYPKIIKPIFQLVNTGGGPNFVDVHKSARGKYIAHVDGDDYALPGKLQKQVEYLDAHSGCNVVWHRVARQRDGEAFRMPGGPKVQGPLIFTIADCLAVGSVAVHSSKMYRASLRENYAGKVKHQYDYELDLLQIDGGLGVVLPDVLGVYRVGVATLTSISDSRSRRMLDAILKEQFRAQPQYRGQISSLFLFLALADLKNQRGHAPRSVKNFIMHFRFESLILLLKYNRIRSQIK
jgi:glycosyltransferase involved in cell wall biosynthesis